MTLPEGAAQQPWLLVRWVFNSRWGLNCYIDDLSVLPTTPKTSPALFTKGVAQFTAETGITHYYDSLQQLVLSIETAGQDIGHVDEGLVLGSGGSSTPRIMAAQNNYVSNPVGWAVTGRYWHIGKWEAPTLPVKVYHYYQPSELQALEAMVRQGNSPILVPGDTLGLMAYMLNGAPLSQVDPVTGHLGVSLAKQYGQTGFWQLDPGEVLDTLQYTTSPAFGQWRTAIQNISTPTSGGLGVGSPKGNGALLPHWININAVRQNRNTVLNWTTGYERYWQMMEVEFATIPEGIFRPLEFVPPFGLPQEGRAYTYTDSRVLPNGRYRYRIKATDFKGRILMSPEVELTINDVKGLLVFPNPAHRGTLNIFSETPMKWLRIVDGLGRVVFSAQPGATQFRGQLPVLAAGVYFVQASILEGIVVQKLLIQP